MMETLTFFGSNDSESKMSAISSMPQNKLKKKTIPFRKVGKNFTSPPTKTTQNSLHSKPPHLNFCKESDSMKLRTIFASSIDTNDKSEQSIKNWHPSKKFSRDNFLILNEMESGKSNLILSMFEDKTTKCSTPSKQLTKQKIANELQNSSIVKNSILNNIGEGPFQVLQRVLSKKKEVQKRQIKSASSLKGLSRSLIQKINKKDEFSENDLMLRYRYESYLHEREKSSHFKHRLLNRSSIQKSHQTININMTPKANPNEKKQNRIFRQSYEKCQSLIFECKQAQNQQRIKKQMSMFTYYNKQFSKKCIRKQKHFTTIERMVQDKIDDKMGQTEYVYDPLV